MVRRAFSEEFKEEAIRLVVEQGYPFSKACGAVGIGECSGSMPLDGSKRR
ncbi:transposase [Burkholderia pseudomallei]